MRAAQDNDDFFLAVISGLSEDASELRVCFIFNPLGHLTLRVKGEATLSSVADVEALEYRFSKPSDGGTPLLLSRGSGREQTSPRR